MRCAATLVALGALVALCCAEDVQEIAKDEAILVPGRDPRARSNKGDKKAGREEEEKGNAISDPDQLSKYNSFMDALLRRLGANYRSRSDPFFVKLVSKKDSSSKKKSNNGRNARKNAKKTNKKSKKQKKGRHPKNMALEDIDDSDIEEEEEEIVRKKRDVELDEDSEDVIELDEEEFNSLFGEELNRVKRDLDEDEDSDSSPLERVERDVDGDEESVAVEEVNRKGKVSKKSKKDSRNRSKNQGKNHQKKGKRAEKSQKNQKKERKGSKKSKSSNPRATITGFGSLSRFGDVEIISRSDATHLKSSFETGPVSIKISKKDENKKERTAKATSQSLHGKIAIEISPNGRATISKVTIDKPDTSEIRVDGAAKAKVSPQFMLRSFGRASPLIAKKVKIAARDILKESSKKA